MASSFSIPHLFVVPTGNTLPTGTTSTLTAGQFGIYLADYTPATAGNAAAGALTDGIQLFQGNPVVIPFETNRRSDKIIKGNVKEWYKVPNRNPGTTQVTEISALKVHCGEELFVTLRINNNLISNAYSNGILKTIRVLAPCCDCGEDPCAEITAAEYDAVYASIRDAINNDQLFKQWIQATVTGSGTAAKVLLAGKASTNPFPDPSADPHNNPFRFDATRFITWLHKDPDVSYDYLTDDRCDIPGVVTVTQRATYPHCTAAEVIQMEKNLFSYHLSNFKTIFCDSDYNGSFKSLVDAAQYDIYYIKYEMPQNLAFTTNVHMNESSIIAVPLGEGAAILAILEAAFGPAKDKTSTADIVFSPLVP